MTRSGSIHVTKYDAKREKDAATNRVNKAKRMIQENIGFRWIVEALLAERGIFRQWTSKPLVLWTHLGRG